eukprot:scaffold248479_cov22-Tisochrysis_lutea.AAC.2
MGLQALAELLRARVAEAQGSSHAMLQASQAEATQQADEDQVLKHESHADTALQRQACCCYDQCFAVRLRDNVVRGMVKCCCCACEAELGTYCSG